MKLCTTVQEMRDARKALGTVGFVPTMGFLHEGHLSLVKRAMAENDAAIVSIFVNPIQFGSSDDLDRYPRALERDLDLLRDAGVAAVFTPDVETLYPEGFVTKVDLGGVALEMEGASRPGHFSGVATVVTKLLNIVQPQRAYFGQKDAQQCAIVRRFVADLNIPTDIVTVPTGREPDGVACSSRNVRLTPEERKKAPGLFKALKKAHELFVEGERSCAILEKEMRDVLHQNGLEHVDYAVVVHPEHFEKINTAPDNALALLAVRVGKVRLIDNILLGV